MREGEEWPEKRDLSSLAPRHVGEPINPEVWEWYREHVGHGRAPVVDTWWQTETGGILITPLPGATPLKPGSASPSLLRRRAGHRRRQRQASAPASRASCASSAAWPGIMRTTYGDHERFVQTYFSTYPGLYFTGDGCRVDEDGDYWLLGRVDDVINVSGHRLGTAEVESALVSTRRWPRPPWSASRTTSRARASTPTSP
jgi:acetyl-CoA synthetase